jgi:DNA helicase-2/ATP-dependent DNA helicase PcrA
MLDMDCEVIYLVTIISLDENPEALFSIVATAKCIRAGPGTGKTYRLIKYVQDLLQNKKVPSNEIQSLAFTRAAAKEFSSRIKTDLGLDEEESPSVRTLHAYSLLKLAEQNALSHITPSIKVADDYEESSIIFRELATRLNTNITEVKEIKSEYENAWHSLDVENPDWLREMQRIEFEEELEKIRRDYGFILRGELVFQFKKLLDADPDLRKSTAPSYLIVDEFQDLNKCDQAVIEYLHEGGSNLLVAGDDDQTIFEFRKANPDCIINFGDNEYTEGVLFTLTTCRRCPSEVLKYANRLILRNTKRVEKLLNPLDTEKQSEVFSLQFSDQDEEAYGIIRLCEYLVHKKKVIPKDILILVSRSNLAPKIVDLAQGSNINAKFFKKGDPIMDDPHVRRAYSLLRVIVDENDAFANRAWLETTPNLGGKTLKDFLKWRKERNLDFLTAIDIISKENGSIPSWMSKIQKSVDELRKLRLEVNKIVTLPEKIDYIIDFQNLNGYENLNEFKSRLESIAQAKQAENISTIYKEIQESQAQRDMVLDDESIRIMTMHSAKGLSARAVILPGMEEELIPGTDVPCKINEWRRILYVSITRSEEFVYFTHCKIRKGRQRFMGSGKGMPFKRRSRFLGEMGITSHDGQRLFE